MVLFSVFAYVAFGIFGIYCIVSGVRKQKEIKAAQQSPDYYMDEKEHDEAIKQIESFEKGYFERVRNGEQTQQFLAVGSNMMCSFLRSLLSAENIPTYTENEHVNSMYSLNALSGNSAFSIKVYILVADYDRAYEIISDFISKHESEENIEESQTSENPVKTIAKAAVTGLFFVNMPDGAEEKVHGITVLPKLS